VVSLTREGGGEVNETNKVNLDKVYARAIVEGWDEAIDLAKNNLPFYDKQIEGDLLTMKAISQRLRNPRIPLVYEKCPIQVGRYERCSCYEYFSKPELGILAPDPDCVVCGGTGEIFISSSREKSYFMGINIYKYWPELGPIGELQLDRVMEISLMEEMDKEYLEMNNDWYREVVQMYRKYRKEGMNPEKAWEKAWRQALNEDGGSDKNDDEEGLAFLP
jgi:hypothetical protein